MRGSTSRRVGPVLHALTVAAALVLTACTPEQTPASAARTAAALRTPADVPTGSAATLQPRAASGTTPAAPPRPIPTPTPGPATLSASPNPVPTQAGRLGSTTISWSTGRPEDGQVYVSEDGQPEKLFASGSTGSQEAPWIRSGASYEFRLYAGTGHSERLAAATVGRPGADTKLSAAPNPVPADDEELGSTTITWTTESGGDVYVSEDGGPERLFASGTRGTEEAAWICRGVVYEFHLYPSNAHTNPLGTVTVTRAEDAPGHEPPPRDRCQA